MTRKNRARLSVVALALGGLVLTACNIPSNEPTSYDDLVRRNFSLGGCQGADPILDGTTSTLAPSNVCECSFAVFVNNVPYNDGDKGKPQYAGYAGKTFLEINNEVKRDGNKYNDNTIVPQAIRDKVKQCKENPSSATLPVTFGTGTTGPGATAVSGATGSSVAGTTPGSAPQ